METRELKQIKDTIVALPCLEKRLSNLNIQLQYANDDMNRLLIKMQEELVDLERLKKESFSVTFLKFISRYERKLKKEEKEYVEAKIRYDKAIENIRNLEEEKLSLQEKIHILKEQNKLYEKEIEKRIDLLLNSLEGDKANKYKDLEQDRERCVRDLVELKEAMGAAGRVMDTLKNIERHLNKAESWATYDIWGGGMLADIAKYDHIDSAKSDFNRLSGQMRELKRELGDIGESFAMKDMGIDSTTRTVDFWFDNIFTDFSVRNKISEDINEVNTLSLKINDLDTKFKMKKRELENHIIEIEATQQQLILEV